MRKQIKIAAIGVAGALGLASAALAQQPMAQGERQNRPANNQMMDHGNMQGGMMGMMHDPEMRRQMMQMMTNCNRMMERMGNMPAGGQPRT
jgi:hypothetical protein